MKTTFSIIFTLLLHYCIQAQYRFDHLTVEHGLVENSVTDIYQDKQGYMWFATQDGISKYDGYTFTNYGVVAEKAISLSDNFLWALTEDSLGNIWCCSRNGLNRINPRTGKCSWFFTDTAAANQINTLLIHEGSLFIVTRGEVFRAPLPANSIGQNHLIKASHKLKLPLDVYAIQLDSISNQVYFFGKQGVYNFTQKRMIKHAASTQLSSHYHLESTLFNGKVWFTNGKQLFYLDQDSIVPANFSVDDAEIFDILRVNDELWVTSSNGVYLFNGTQTNYRITKSEIGMQGLSSNYITSGYVGLSRKVWLGSAEQGLSIYDPFKDYFKYLGAETLGYKNVVKGVLQDKKNRLFIYGSNASVLQMNETSICASTFAQSAVQKVKPLKIAGINPEKITSMALGFNQDILVATQHNGLWLVNENLIPQKKIIRTLQDSGGFSMTNIVKDKGNDLWVASSNGIYVLDQNYHIKSRFKPYEKGLNATYIIAIFCDAENNIWLGTNQGIYTYKRGQNCFINYPYLKDNMEKGPAFNFVTQFADFGDGDLWMSTFGGGLSQLNKEEKTFKHYGFESGLNNNVCNALLTDKHNKTLWLSTNRGISVFNPKTARFKNYNRSDGLLFNEFVMASSFVNYAGEFFFGTPVGIVVFDPNQIKTSSFEPSLYINQLDINYENALERILGNTLKLYHKDKAITFGFAGLNFSNSSRIKYRYKLNRYNDDWVETEDPFASYTSLPSGQYTFMVNVTNPDGIWNTKPTELKVIVHPPFYQTWWFLTAVFLILFTLIALVIRYISQRKLKQNLNRMKVLQEVNNEKQRISRDLHDNLGAELTYISSIIDQKAYLVKDPDKKADLELISNSSRHAMQQMRETIWAIQTDQISISRFAEKVRSTSKKYTSIKNIKLNVRVSGDDYILPPSKVIILLRICQESINNAVKYSHCTEIIVDINAEEGNYAIEIMDNGIGFNLKTVKKGYGLLNMQERASEIGGTIKIESKEGKGTRVVLNATI